MALLALSEDEQRILFTQLCNVLDPRGAVDFSSTNSGLWVLMQALRQQLRTDHEVAAALCLKLGMRSCKELREARVLSWFNKGLAAADLEVLGTLGSVLPALERLMLNEAAAGAAGPDGVQRLVAGLGASALPALITFALDKMYVGDAGASALAAALGRGALPRLKTLALTNAAIGDVGLVALAPALRRLPALVSLNLGNDPYGDEALVLMGNPFGDEGLAALLAPLPPPPAGALPPPTGVLTKLKELYLDNTQITDAGCAALAAALDGAVLPALEDLNLRRILASEAAKDALMERFPADSDYDSDDSDEEF